jgi:hypothetical protein
MVLKVQRISRRPRVAGCAERRGTSSENRQGIEFVYQGEPELHLKIARGLSLFTRGSREFAAKSPGDDWGFSKSAIWMG